MKRYHYTYRITNTRINKHYYGTRSSKVKPIYDLGIIYFSSSKDKDFIKDQKENPSDYKYKVIQIFDTRKDSLALEIKLHNKFNVGINESFYNRAKQTSIGFDVTGTKLSDKTKRKMKNAWTDERKQKHIENREGKCLSEELKQKMSQLAYNRNSPELSKKLSKGHTKELREMYGQKITKLNNKLVVCTYCCSKNNIGNITKYHQGNCKLNPDNNENLIGDYSDLYTRLYCPYCKFSAKNIKSISCHKRYCKFFK